MKNKFILFFGVLIMLCGCSSNPSKEVEQIKVYGDSNWIFDDTTITIPKDYSFNDFSKVYSEDTITVTLNYKKIGSKR